MRGGVGCLVEVGLTVNARLEYVCEEKGRRCCTEDFDERPEMRAVSVANARVNQPLNVR